MTSVFPQTQQSNTGNLLKAPIFLVGAERSGTTVLRLMLRNHPQICWCQEFEYTVDLMTDGGRFPDLDTYYEWLETHRIFRMTGFEIDRALDYPHLIDSFLRQQLDRAGKPIVGATIHRHFDRILHIWPDARFIHLIRDPRDVARSCIGMGWVSNVWSGCQRWIEAEQIWNKLSQVVPEERRIELTYEELITDAKLALTRLCEFIGVDYDGAMLAYDGSSTYSAPDPSLIQQWRKKLSEREIRLVESRVGNLLTERGYESSGLPPIEVTPLMRRQMRFQDWSFRAQHRLKVFGLPLFLADTLTRKLGWKALQKPIRLKMNAIEVSRLK
jgi:Sulfotransferase family